MLIWQPLDHVVKIEKHALKMTLSKRNVKPQICWPGNLDGNDHFKDFKSL